MPTRKAQRKTSRAARTGTAARSPGSTRRAAHGKAFPVVGIGASAGGLEAVTKFLEYLPRETGLAFVLVQHLDPTHESKLTELLGRATAMPVVEARNGMRVAPDHVYVIPPNRCLVMDGGGLKLTARGRGRVLPVDTFLKSLAAERGRQAIGVILSGTATDGAEGVQAIKAAGGITFAQDEKSAKYDGMPAAAIVTGCVDFVLPPELIARELAAISRHPYVKPAPATGAAAVATGDGLQQILRLLLAASGVDFTHYKPGTLQRRIHRRMALHKLHKLDRYAEFLQTHAGEAEKLYEDLLIAVTGFFRDPAAFQALRKKVFPRLLKQRNRGDAIRIWVPGCSSGEEAYSVAITLLDHLGARASHVPLQIFATDISDRALDKARAGVYPASIATVVGRERLRRYFTEVRGCYQINKDIRERCVFARQNLAKDPPFSNLDLISCRNVLIYLGPQLQQRVLSVFHYALKPHGLLLLGASESLTGFQNLFGVVDKTQKVFAKKPAARRTPLDFRSTEFPAGPPEPLLVAGKAGWRLPDMLKEADRLLATRFAPASVLINDECEILQFRGHTGAYLEPASGTASLNLLKMAREGLLMGLRPALAKARKQRTPVRQEGLRVNANGATRTVNLEIVPLKLAGTTERHWLVLFEEPAATAATAAPAAPAPPARPLTKSESDRQIAQLEQELSATKEYMQSVVEDFEAANEELKAANEEVQSSNEELQSTNEELETAKEELQSANEELTTVNEELQTRNVELGELNEAVNRSLQDAKVARDYAEAIITTSRQPLAVLDGGLRVQNVNAAFLRTFQVTRNQTVGQHIYQLGNRQWNIPKLRRLLEKILPANTHFDDYRVELTFPKIGQRTLLLNARRLVQADGQPPLILLALEDITERQRTRAELEQRVQERTAALRESEEGYRLMFELNPAPMFIFDENTYEFIAVNSSALKLYGWSRKEFLRMSTKDIRPPEDVPDYVRAVKKQRGSHAKYGGEWRHRKRDGTVFNAVVTVSSIPYVGRKARLVLVNDITARKQAEAALRDSEARYRALFEQAVDPVVVFDPKTNGIVEFNDVAFRQLGYTRREFGRLTIPDVEVIETAVDVRRHTRLIIREGGDTFETKQRTKQGKVLDIEVRAKPIQLGERTLIQCFWLDITARKRAETELRRLTAALEQRVTERTGDLTEANDRLRAIADNALVGILTLDGHGIVQTFNPAAAQIFGYQPDEVVGLDVSRLMASPAQLSGEEFLTHYTQPGDQRFMAVGREVLGRRKDGHGIMLDLTLSDFTHGGRRQFVAMVSDITERKRLERELLEITERERQRVGHDLHDGLGQQLHGLSYLAALLERGLREEASPRTAEARNLNKYLKEALEMIRSLAHGLQPVKTVPEGLMNALAELAERTRGLYRVECRFECRAPVHIHRHSAANHLYRIAQEAVNNAMKHGKPTRIRIQLSATPERIVLGVRDNGVGIRRRARSGRGMGLHVMQYRADAIRGSLLVQRHPRGGTEVVCTVARQVLLPEANGIK